MHEMCIYIYMYICTHTHTYIYIYIYKERPRELILFCILLMLFLFYLILLKLIVHTVYLSIDISIYQVLVFPKISFKQRLCRSIWHSLKPAVLKAILLNVLSNLPEGLAVG